MATEESERRGAPCGGRDRAFTTAIGEPPEDIYERAKRLGRNRIQRRPRAIVTESVIGGVHVTFSGLGALTLVAVPAVDGLGSRLDRRRARLPVGFLFVVFGGSELFTEDFLAPSSRRGATRPHGAAPRACGRPARRRSLQPA